MLRCETRSCHAGHHADLEGHRNYSRTIYSFSILCLEHHYCGDQQCTFTYLKVQFAKCPCLLPVALVLRIWSCLHHCPVMDVFSLLVRQRAYTNHCHVSVCASSKRDSDRKCGRSWFLCNYYRSIESSFRLFLVVTFANEVMLSSQLASLSVC